MVLRARCLNALNVAGLECIGGRVRMLSVLMIIGMRFEKTRVTGLSAIERETRCSFWERGAFELRFSNDEYARRIENDQTQD